MASDKLDPLNWNVPIVEPATGNPTAEFMRKWKAQRTINVGILTVQQLLDSISAVRGSLLYRGAAGWVSLPPGTAGKFLETLGPGADPLWATPDVQGFLDSIGNTRGSILYRGASGWAILVPGTSGFVLTSQGSGADPHYAASGGGGGSLSPFWATPPTLPTLAGTGLALFKDAGTTASLTDVTRGISISVLGAGAVDRNVCVDKVTPGSTGWTLTTLLVPNLMVRDFMTLGLYARDSAGGKIHVFAFGGSGGFKLRDIYWTNITTFSSTADLPFLNAFQGPLWMQLVDTGTNFVLNLSFDGEMFWPQLTVSRTAFLPGAATNYGVWLGVNQQASGTPPHATPQNITETSLIMAFTG